MMKHIVVLGSTGSIGRNTLEILKRHRDRFKLVGMAAGENRDLLIEQIREFEPEWVSVKNKPDAESIQGLFPDKKLFWGEQGLRELVLHPRADTVVAAITGTTLLRATLEAIRAGRRVCLANKETLVAAGELINSEAATFKAEIIPIDSEQSAIFQCIGGNSHSHIRRIILTASGGPFFRRDIGDFTKFTVQEALAHPVWSMGNKITIDSATLANKAFEKVEAFYLFKLRPEQIEVIIHPQSIVHSLVEFIDSSIIAQLSRPDMKIPILYSLTYPERFNDETPRLDFAGLGRLEFHPVDQQKFPALNLADFVLATGKNSGAVFHAANEVAVDAFLDSRISFQNITSAVRDVLFQSKFYPLGSVDDVEETIRETKKIASDYLKSRGKKW